MASKVSTGRGKTATKKDVNKNVRKSKGHSAVNNTVKKTVVKNTVKNTKSATKAVGKNAAKSATNNSVKSSGNSVKRSAKNSQGKVLKTNIKKSLEKTVRKTGGAERKEKKSSSAPVKARTKASSDARKGAKVTSARITATRKSSSSEQTVNSRPEKKTPGKKTLGKKALGIKTSENLSSRIKAAKSGAKGKATLAKKNAVEKKTVTKKTFAKGKVEGRKLDAEKDVREKAVKKVVGAKTASSSGAPGDAAMSVDSTEIAGEKDNAQFAKAESGKIVYPTPTITELKNFRKASEIRRKLREASQHDVKATKRRFLAKEPAKGTRYSIDLRIHSPGTIGYFSAGGVDPGPAMLRLSKAKGLDMIGVTDYYNAAAVDMLKECKGTLPLTIIPGFDMRCEVSGCREVFFTVLFPEETTAEMIFAVLQALRIPESVYGNREYCLTRPLGEILEVIESHQGVVIPSRIDKTPYRQLAIPALVENYGFHTFDLIHPDNTEFFRERWPEGEFTFLSFSNAHALAQIGSRRSNMRLEKPGFEGLKERVSRRS